MAKNDNLHDFLVDVADAIREKKGTTDLINPQNFSEEILSIEGSSPFAVDFGEEIASGNPTFINALQEDIDYYNEVKARIASGEAINTIWEDAEFRRRIAWIPPEMQVGGYNQGVTKCFNLYVFPFNTLGTSQYNGIKYMKRLQSLKVDASEVTRLGFFLYSGYVGDIDLRFDSLTQIQQQAFQYFISNRIVIDFPKVISVGGSTFHWVSLCKYMDINFPMLERLNVNCIRECLELEELHLNIPNVTSQSYSVYNNTKLRICHLKGMQCSFSIGSSVLEIESVKYMLDNCQAREDGASYTLNIDDAVKQNFLNKCTEGHEDYDAEYAASLASATEKGLTLA